DRHARRRHHRDGARGRDRAHLPARGPGCARRDDRPLLRGGPGGAHARADRRAPRRALVGGAGAIHGRAAGRAAHGAGLGMSRAPVAIALAALLTFMLTGGWRIVGSDEVTMFQLARAMAHGRIDVPEGATLQGPDGRFYSKNTAGEAVLALPLVVAG